MRPSVFPSVKTLLLSEEPCYAVAAQPGLSLSLEENEMPAPSALEKLAHSGTGGQGLLQPSSQVTTPCKPGNILNYTLNQLILWSSYSGKSTTEFNCSDSIKTFLSPD